MKHFETPEDVFFSEAKPAPKKTTRKKTNETTPTEEEVRKMAAAYGMELKPTKRTSRLQVLISPENHTALKKSAKKEKIPVNELVNRIIIKYLREEGRI